MIEPRKLPRQQRSAATVALILEATARILAEGGLNALTTNAVAARAGVSIGSLYQYFPGKTALLTALIRAERLELAQGLDRALLASADAPLPGVMAALIAAAVDHQLDRPALSRVLELAEMHLPIDAETQALSSRIGSQIARVLTRFGVAHPHLAAADCVAMARGMIDAAGLRKETEKAALADRVCRAVLGFLAGADRV